ncbi:hypothetical protein EVAR_14921_1 [Eumeta japonica]|uniref:Uncharacterized protein n=1 Tax=Eumeta variegata TaxID=151549 RepID=A0A4C1XMM1_EUMVA|nr:hypothetical protein EVAR_14921_1 [Eumeta japonica]
MQIDGCRDRVQNFSVKRERGPAPADRCRPWSCPALDSGTTKFASVYEGAERPARAFEQKLDLSFSLRSIMPQIRLRRRGARGRAGRTSPRARYLRRYFFNALEILSSKRYIIVHYTFGGCTPAGRPRPIAGHLRSVTILRETNMPYISAE